MDITAIKIDSKNKRHLVNQPMEVLLDVMTHDDAKGTIADFRLRFPFLRANETTHEGLLRLPRIYPAAQFVKNQKGDIRFQSSNGLLMFSVDGLQTAEEVQHIKQLAATLPTTLLAIQGVSGQTVKVLIRIAQQDGTLPTTEEQSEALYQSALPQAQRLYEAMLGTSITPSADGIRSSFRRTLDASPYYNPSASPLLINKGSKIENQKSKTPPEERYNRYSEGEFLYTQAAKQAREDQNLSPSNPEAFYTAILTSLCSMQMPQEEAITHVVNHTRGQVPTDLIRNIASSVYEEQQASSATPSAISIRKDTQQMIHFLQSRYLFRHNTVMGYTEYRPNDSYLIPFQPVDSRVTNRIVIEARLAGINVWTADVTRYLDSDFIPKYSPIQSFLDQCEGKWDGRDRITELAQTIPTNCPLWPQWFRTWFLAMVHQWQSTLSARYGNSVAPLLISKQGYNKSTFCRRLIPAELRWGYIDNLQIAEKKQVLQAMSQYLLINLDEFNQISPALQQGFLKNVIQLATVKGKRPYGKHTEEFPRLASFIATSNMSDVLSDPTGNRRFIGIEINAPIDVKYSIDYEQLYAQALQLIEEGAPTYFDAEQTRLIMRHNDNYKRVDPIEALFRSHFAPARENEQGEWLTAASIFEHLRSLAGSSLRVNQLSNFGRTLSNLPDLKSKHTMRGTSYHVLRLK